MNDKRIYLKVKIKSLAMEAKIIRFEENRSLDASLRAGLSSHRRTEVRREARATLIAYGYLRGKTYRCIEPPTTRDGAERALALSKAKSMVARYGAPEAKEGFDPWAKVA